MVFHLQRRAPQECGVGLVIETINVVIFCWGKSVRKYFTLSDRDTKKTRLIPELWYQAEKNAIHYRKFVKHVIEVNSRFKDQPEHFSFRRILSHKRDSYDYSGGPLFCKLQLYQILYQILYQNPKIVQNKGNFTKYGSTI